MTIPRRVVTGHDPDGTPIVVVDGPPPHAVDQPGGTAAADLWSLAGPATSVEDGFEPVGGFPIEPPAGGLWWRYVRLPAPDPASPREQQFLVPHGGTAGGGQGMHATASIDFVTIVDGAIELDTEHGSVELAAGDCVVQRGTQHRWRVLGDRPCSYLVALCSPRPPSSDPLVDPSPAGVAATDEAGRAPAPDAVGSGLPAAAVAGAVVAPAGASAVRRIVVGTGPDGRSTIVADDRLAIDRLDGAPPLVDLWHTHGALTDVAQGGPTSPAGHPLQLAAGAVSWRHVQLTPATPAVRHRTATIDLDVVVEGQVELSLPGSDGSSGSSTVLEAGDCVVQRGTEHAWRAVGGGPARLLAIMIGVGP